MDLKSRRCSKRPEASEQAKTNKTFSDKWRRFKQYGLEPEHKEFLFGWYCKKLGVPDLDALKAFYGSKKRVLEVGPGPASTPGLLPKIVRARCLRWMFLTQRSRHSRTRAILRIAASFRPI